MVERASRLVVRASPASSTPTLAGIWRTATRPLTEEQVRERALTALAEEIRLMLDEGVVAGGAGHRPVHAAGRRLAVLAGRHLRLPGPDRRRRGRHREAVPAPRGGLACPPDAAARADLQPREPRCRAAPAVARRLRRGRLSPWGRPRRSRAGVLRSLRIHGQPPPPMSPNSLSPRRHGVQARHAGQLVGDGEPADAVLARPSISQVSRLKPSAAAVGSMQHPPGLHQPAGRVDLEHLAVDDDLGESQPIAADACFISSVANARYAPPGPQLVLGGRRVAVAAVPLRVGDRLPDPLRRGLDVDAVDLRRAGRLVGAGGLGVVMTAPPVRA